MAPGVSETFFFLGLSIQGGDTGRDRCQERETETRALEFDVAVGPGDTVTATRSGVQRPIPGASDIPGLPPRRRAG